MVDFGFTREYEGKASYLQTWCGTVCYSAPEMLKGEKYAGEKVDVWSLGIILYALLCGELPFDEDDENATKARILKEEPNYPGHIPEQAKDLITKLLSKRPLLRPTLADILQHPWLTEHAPQQQAILKLQQPAPFTTDLEKDTLRRMRSAGVDIDMVIENVLAQRCDSLAGWWALLLEKEERKVKRRERKRREREAEAKSLRRLSATSSRLERIAPTIKEADEETQNQLQVPVIGDPPRSRGRTKKRSSMTCTTLCIPHLFQDADHTNSRPRTPQTSRIFQPKITHAPAARGERRTSRLDLVLPRSPSPSTKGTLHQHAAIRPKLLRPPQRLIRRTTTTTQTTPSPQPTRLHQAVVGHQTRKASGSDKASASKRIASGCGITATHHRHRANPTPRHGPST